MGGRSMSDNFKKRFGDPARIKIQTETKKASFPEESYRSQKIAEASIDILRGVLGREPTQDEILGKVDISRAKKAKDRVTHE
jgi:DNA-directed RNA polymerase specialized sigma subunit